MKKSLLVLLTIVMFFISVNCFAFGNSTTNNNIVAPVQGQTQAQAMLQAQSTNIRNNVAQANAQLNKQTNTQINGQLNNQKTSIVFEDVREYVATTNIDFLSDATPHNEERTIARRGRKFVSFSDQAMFGNIRTVAVAKRMNKGFHSMSNAFKTTVDLMAMVNKGDYKETDRMAMFDSKEKFIEKLKKANLEEKDVITIGMVFADTRAKHGNSVYITNESIIKGTKLGANCLVIISQDTERTFKHRSIGSGAGVSDATNSPDTVFNGLLSGGAGSKTYAENPFIIGYVVRVP